MTVFTKERFISKLMNDFFEVSIRIISIINTLYIEILRFVNSWFHMVSKWPLQSATR